MANTKSISLRLAFISIPARTFEQILAASGVRPSEHLVLDTKLAGLDIAFVGYDPNTQCVVECRANGHDPLLLLIRALLDKEWRARLDHLLEMQPTLTLTPDGELTFNNNVEPPKMQFVASAGSQSDLLKFIKLVGPYGNDATESSR